MPGTFQSFFTAFRGKFKILKGFSTPPHSSQPVSRTLNCPSGCCILLCFHPSDLIRSDWQPLSEGRSHFPGELNFAHILLTALCCLPGLE